MQVIAAEDEGIRQGTYMQERGEAAVVLLLQRYLQRQQCRVRYEALLMIRWDSQVNPMPTNIPTLDCIMHSKVSLLISGRFPFLAPCSLSLQS